MASVEEAIENFMGITSLPRANAVEWLKVRYYGLCTAQRELAKLTLVKQ